jgi:hypothetical protein
VLSSAEEKWLVPDRKQLKTCRFLGAEKGMVTWIKCAHDKNIPVSGQILREKAEQFAKKLGHSEFKAGTGWLDKFKSHNGISHKVLNGESAAVSDIDYDYCRKEILPQLIQNYDPRDIFNTDETSLLF